MRLLTAKQRSSSSITSILFLTLLPFTLSQTPDATTLLNASATLQSQISIRGGCLFQDIHLAGNPTRNLAAIWLRSLFHDAGTWNAQTRTGGADGSLTTELNLPENTGQGRGIPTNFLPGNLSDADKIAMGAAVALRHCGGPNVPFQSGRQDAPKSTPNDLTLLPADPFADLANVTATFARMGLTKTDMLVLVAGSHSLVTLETFLPFDDTPGVFDNNVFKKILQNRCVLKIDCAFGTDPELLPLITLYATNQSAFFEQYATSFTKMMSLTSSPLNPPIDLNISIHENLLAEGDLEAFRVGMGLPPLVTSTSTRRTTATTTATSSGTALWGGGGFLGLLVLLMGLY
ncbi:heme peroxidase [Chytridium lagenaria]|nr:heme peroxidase [Chytridium lagenaria]